MIKRGASVIFLSALATCSVTAVTTPTPDGGTNNPFSPDAGTGPGNDAGGLHDTGTGVEAGPTDCRTQATTTISSNGNFYVSPRFSPDGSQIAVQSFSGFTFQDILVLDRCGKVLHSLGVTADARSGALLPLAWSPDGSAVYFLGQMGEMSVRKVPVAGGASTIVYTGPNTEFDLSPDGTNSVYDGSNGLTLYPLPNGPGVDLGNLIGGSPRFSPDGKKISFITNAVIRVVALDTKVAMNVVDLTNDFGLGGAVWAPDGASLIAPTKTGVERITLADGTKKTLVALAQVSAVDVTKDGTALVYALNGQPDLTVITGF
jgi:hypothetical protein